MIGTKGRLITVELGQGQWVHAMYEGENVTLCGKTKNIRPSSEERANCIKCLQNGAKHREMTPGDEVMVGYYD